jgi:hypothetical protein
MNPISWTRGGRFLSFFAFAFVALGAVGRSTAADVTPPAQVSGLHAQRVGNDVHLTWDPVTSDAAGQSETIAQYRIYRGTSPDFSTDASTLIGTATTTASNDVGAAASPSNIYYLVSAIDASGNESASRDSRVTAPVLSGHWTDTTIELNWTPAAPANQISSYRVYYGRKSGHYEAVQDVGLATSVSLAGLQVYTNWYAAVTSVDLDGNESAFSNEHVDPVAGRVRVRAQDDDYLCWLDADQCPPDAGEVQRNGGWQLMVPVTFPEGDWKRVQVKYTLDSRLCEAPAQGTVNRCGESAAQGGWNPCGDPWDRLAHLFLVLDESCISGTGSCINDQNLELMRAITPFGTDAPPPDGSGFVPPRELTLDVTPFSPLFVGTRYVGAEIVNYTQAGWHVTVEFEFSERPDEASSKLPADGFQIVGFSGAPLPTRNVTIPSTATKVFARVFTSGHGGTLYCDGGSNNGSTCTSNANCPGGVCNPCDEFCHRTNRILKDGVAVWTAVPWRTDCSPAANKCYNWNSCGYPSCTYPRAGWCPGYIACPGNGPCDNDIDLTGILAPGGSYGMSYDVLVQRGSWPVSFVIYWNN